MSLVKGQTVSGAANNMKRGWGRKGPAEFKALGPHQPDIYVNGGLLNRMYFTLVKQLDFEANHVFSPRTHKCRVGADNKSIVKVGL